jgi:hypothetical protein
LAANKLLILTASAPGKGDYSTPSVAPSVRSNLTTILGRTAACKKAEITWGEIMRANEKLHLDLKGLKA